MHPSLDCYLVGGAVRDILLGLEPKDKDYCVVGSDENDMLAYGFKRVGVDFPVFHHPHTKEEYALARKERKTGNGYGGFQVISKGVTLEEDLFRRDLTINAMAMDKEGKLIDPYNGATDLKNKVLRHVSKHFAEDPVRILRICRFAARYNFTIADETLDMMRDMVSNGEFDHLTKERIVLEFQKVMMEPHIENFFSNLKSIGALSKLGKFESVFNNDIQELFKNAPTEEIRAYYVFNDFNEYQMKEFKLPGDLIDNIYYIKKWNSQRMFYDFMPDDVKLQFHTEMKTKHSSEKALEIGSALLYIHSIRWDIADQQLYNLNKDIESIRSFNAETYVKELQSSQHFKDLNPRDRGGYIRQQMDDKTISLLNKVSVAPKRKM